MIGGGVLPLYCPVCWEVEGGRSKSRFSIFASIDSQGVRGSLLLLDWVGFQGPHMASSDTVIGGVVVTTEYW